MFVPPCCHPAHMYITNCMQMYKYMYNAQIFIMAQDNEAIPGQLLRAC